ncbi:MAG: hypothetical protein ACI8W3_001937 [Myxococcota bacterium]|jgi:uncharacterized protein YheU (UPF0270 family)
MSGSDDDAGDVADIDVNDDEERYLVIDASQISDAALRGLVEEFASRDGTDYGSAEKTLDQKVSIVMRQVESGDVCVVFDRDEEVVNLVLARELAGLIS